MKKEGSKGFSVALTAIIVVLALAAGGFMLFKDTTPPTISVAPDGPYLGREAKITIAVEDPGSGLKSIVVAVVQKGKRTVLADRTFPGGSMQTEETIDLARGEIAEGEFSIEITARDASIYPFGAAGVAVAHKDYVFDATPPRIFVQSHTNNLNQGGSGLMVFTLSEPAVSAGIRVGERFFPAYQQPEGDNLYHCMFTMPWDTPPSAFKPMIEATDKAGNTASRTFSHHANPRQFRKDRINLSDSFFETTIPEFQGLVPNSGTLLDQYLFINRELRKQNRDTLVELGRQTSPTMLWSGPFARLPNAANRARFADARDYYYQGKIVDHQTHMGLDLASLKNAAVPAGNHGTIVFADFLGIYGNVVVIDHGLGLQSIYAHLNSMEVEVGQTVSKDDIVGHTGITGLAGGDHLHYEINISGVPVQPIEWWDDNWIRNNITSKLE
ncbi:peptidoglycan DD-metalloendopeptidase family protein [Pseudodesulfovibrio sp. F-1]|uniref:Peptidoglycan DD-metalloendopeptidase family protein n=1 Tax=Pseudodesulfovibrio alkaliphilus TaxID=2661613 RepID=A0A7K1KQX3_9BACT|nr:M23 family metallopeptidase [Pseudodesulfovibrio alkaliphilus]MUM78312.1 peptidoglycan DD-metalloendopeptidase family protein [Pseudodesulfovibrio alkaliphilus]